MPLINVSSMIIPIMILFIIAYALIKKIDIYDVFITGAKEGISISVDIFPYLIGMILAINILIKSHFIFDFLNFLKPVFSFIKVPVEIVPMSIMRPISGNASLVLMNNLFTQYGVDSFIGRLASTIQGTTETTLYVITLYFGVVGIKKIRYAMWAGLFADLIGVIASIIIVSLIFGNN